MMMKTSALLLVVVVVVVCFCGRGSLSSSAGDAFSRSLQMALQNLNDAGLEEAIERTEDEHLFFTRPYVPIGSWRDCGGPKTAAHFKGFQMNDTCLKTPGRILIGFNISSDRDVTPPISVQLKVQLKKERGWTNVCDQLAGGCRRDDVCAKGDELSSAEETEADDEREQVPLSAPSASVCIAKGLTVGVKGSYEVPKAPGGVYKVVARFRKGSDPVACLSLSFKVCD